MALIVGGYQFHFLCQRRAPATVRELRLPVDDRTPFWPAWVSAAERFLAHVQRFDARSNSFPSMHTSVAMLTALHLDPSLAGWASLLPVLIGLSCLFTTRHFVIDGPAGAALSWATFRVFTAVVA